MRGNMRALFRYTDDSVLAAEGPKREGGLRIFNKPKRGHWMRGEGAKLLSSSICGPRYAV